MRSTRPKPLHVLCGKAMLVYVLDALADCKLDRVVVVVGRGGERVAKKLQDESPAHVVEFVEQVHPAGTGDAVAAALTSFGDEDDLDDPDVLVLPGDTPLLRPATIAALAEEHDRTGAVVTVLTARPTDRSGYARVVRGKGDRVVALVDPDDATEDQLAIAEVSSGVYCFRRSLLAPALRRVLPRPGVREYFLSDVVQVLAETGHPIATFEVDDPTEVVGVNDRVQLAAAEGELRRRTNLAWLRRGVTMLDPDRTYIDTTVEIGHDVTLFPGTMLQGRTVVGEGSEIGPDTRLEDSEVGRRCTVGHSVATRATIGDDCVIGPYAALAPGATIESGSVTGPFYAAGGPEE